MSRARRANALKLLRLSSQINRFNYICDRLISAQLEAAAGAFGRVGGQAHRERTEPVGRVVLLVQRLDDDGLDMYAEFLHHAGLAPVAVSNAADALTLASEADVIVTGIVLDGQTDGVELVSRLRGARGTMHKPIIVLTSCAWPHERERAEHAGFDVFLSKPCLPDALLREVRVLAAHKWVVHVVNDARRTVDYLDSRADIRRVVWHSLARVGGFVRAPDTGARHAIQDSGAHRRRVFSGDRDPAGEFDQLNYVPRVTVPLLMINGVGDFIFPVETAQRPFFDRLGTAHGQKRKVTFQGGHYVIQQ